MEPVNHACRRADDLETGVLQTLAHPTRFERVTFAFGGLSVRFCGFAD